MKLSKHIDKVFSLNCCGVLISILRTIHFMCLIIVGLINNARFFVNKSDEARAVCCFIYNLCVVIFPGIGHRKDRAIDRLNLALQSFVIRIDAMRL